MQCCFKISKVYLIFWKSAMLLLKIIHYKAIKCCCFVLWLLALIYLVIIPKGVVDLLDVSIMEDGSTVQLQCVYAENSIVHGCLILIQCVDSSLTKSITLSEGQTYPLQGCELPCVKGTLYGYANNHGIVADEPSIIESIDFKQCISSPTPSPGNAKLLTTNNNWFVKEFKWFFQA